MVVETNTNYAFKIQLFFFKILTWGILSYILMVITIIVMFLTIVFILGHYKIIKFTLIEKFRFIKNYFYMYSSQKFAFIKYYVREIWELADKKKLYIIFFGILLIIGIMMYIFLQIKRKG